MNDQERFEILKRHGLKREKWERSHFVWLHGLLRRDQGRGKGKLRMNQLYVMIDIETSKSHPDTWQIDKTGKRIFDPNPNYIVAWSMAVSVMGVTVHAVYDTDPETLPDAMEELHSVLPGNYTVFYAHNLSYDYVFLRKIFFGRWGYPTEQLATKPHYPIKILFENGIELRDSMIIAQRSLEKWATDLNVKTGKAVGKWNYDRIRHQREHLSPDEIDYVLSDVIAGVECLAALRLQLKCGYRKFPLTATSIPRNELGEICKKHHEHRRVAAWYDYTSYLCNERFYHGGYTHANRWHVGDILPTTCYDFASEYPAKILLEKMPQGSFHRWPGENLPDIDFFAKWADNEAFLIHIAFENLRLKDHFFPMPFVQLSKMDLIMEPIVDNGRVIKAAYAEFWTNEIEIQMLQKWYTWDDIEIQVVFCAAKEYLPRYITDYVYELFRQKTQLKGGDPVAYAISKAKINSIYGMMVQKLLRIENIEDYETGDYLEVDKRTEEDFQKQVKRWGLYLYYPVGVWITSYAMRDLFELGQCAADPDDWIYSDTDSCYFTHVDESKIANYNNNVIMQFSQRGYAPVEFNGKSYVPGVAEFDGSYEEFRSWHAKCYAKKHDGKISITVAGVPKRGAAALESLEDFKPGFVFPGEITEKKTHVYAFIERPYRNEFGDLICDSINLIPCDYKVSTSVVDRMDQLLDGVQDDGYNFFDEIDLSYE